MGAGRKWGKHLRIRLQGSKEWTIVELVANTKSPLPQSVIVAAPEIPNYGSKQLTLDGKAAACLRRNYQGLWLDVLSGWLYELKSVRDP